MYIDVYYCTILRLIIYFAWKMKLSNNVSVFFSDYCVKTPINCVFKAERTLRERCTVYKNNECAKSLFHVEMYKMCSEGQIFLGHGVVEKQIQITQLNVFRRQVRPDDCVILFHSSCKYIHIYYLMNWCRIQLFWVLFMVLFICLVVVFLLLG
jgi:hypothetical protein